MKGPSQRRRRRPSLVQCNPSRHLRSVFRLQNLKQFVLFLPLSIVFFERIWIPFEGSYKPTTGDHGKNSALHDYLDVSRVAVSQRFKQQKRQVSPISSSPTMEPYYSLERITSFDRIGRSTCSMSFSPFSWWGNSKKETKMTWMENKYVISFSSTGISGGRDSTKGHIDGTDEQQQSSSNTITAFPRRLHIYSPSRCVSNNVRRSIEMWYGNSTTTTSDGSRKTNEIGWDLFVHDEKALTRLLNVESVEGDFSEMRSLLRHCLSPTHKNEQRNADNDGDSISELRQTLWQLLVLYVYGGMYVSTSSALLAPEVEGRHTRKQGPPEPVFDVERLLNDIYRSSISSPSGIVVLFESEISSTPSASPYQQEEDPRATKYFNPGAVASSPKHPFLFLAIRHLLLGILNDDIYDRIDLYGDGPPQDEVEDYDLPPLSRALQRAWVDYSASSMSSATGNGETMPPMGDLKRTIRIFDYVDYFPPPDSANENGHKGKMFAHLWRRKKKIDPTTSRQGSRTTSTTESSTCLQKMAEAASDIDFT